MEKNVTSLSILNFMNIIAWDNPRIMKKKERERKEGERRGER